MGKLNEIAQKAYECAVRRGKIDPDNDSNNNLHRDLLEEVAEVFECTGEKSPHIKEYLDVEEELADVIIVALSTLHHFKCDIDSLIEAKMNYGEFYQFNLSSCIRQQNSLTAQFVSFSLSNLANIFYPPQFLQ